VLKGPDQNLTIEYSKELSELQKVISAGSLKLKNGFKKINALKHSASKAAIDNTELMSKIHFVKQKLFNLEEKLNGNKSKNEVGENSFPTLQYRVNKAATAFYNSTYGPTPTHIKSLEIAKKQYSEFSKKLNNILEVEIPFIEKALLKAGAPVVE